MQTSLRQFTLTKTTRDPEATGLMILTRSECTHYQPLNAESSIFHRKALKTKSILATLIIRAACPDRAISIQVFGVAAVRPTHSCRGKSTLGLPHR
jgi:hypothetical protein